jgi:hypothetical protein
MSIPTTLISLFRVARLRLLQPFPQRYTVKEAGEPVELARYPLAQCDSETLHHASQGKEAEPSGCNPDPTQCESEAMVHFLITLVAQSQERCTSNAEDPGGSPGGGAIWGISDRIRHDRPAPGRVRGSTEILHQFHSRVAQKKEQQLAKLKAVGATPAVGTTFKWMVNRGKVYGLS